MLGAGIGLVAELHRRPLLLREGGGAAVGEEVDEDVLGPQQEGVVAGLRERLPGGRRPRAVRSAPPP